MSIPPSSSSSSSIAPGSSSSSSSSSVASQGQEQPPSSVQSTPSPSLPPPSFMPINPMTMTYTQQQMQQHHHPHSQQQPPPLTPQHAVSFFPSSQSAFVMPQPQRGSPYPSEPETQINNQIPLQQQQPYSVPAFPPQAQPQTSNPIHISMQPMMMSGPPPMPMPVPLHYPQPFPMHNMYTMVPTYTYAAYPTSAPQMQTHTHPPGTNGVIHRVASMPLVHPHPAHGVYTPGPPQTVALPVAGPSAATAAAAILASSSSSSRFSPSWTCPGGCGKVLNKRSFRSLKKHKLTCELYKQQQPLQNIAVHTITTNSTSVEHNDTQQQDAALRNHHPLAYANHEIDQHHNNGNNNVHTIHTNSNNSNNNYQNNHLDAATTVSTILSELSRSPPKKARHS